MRKGGIKAPCLLGVSKGRSQEQGKFSSEREGKKLDRVCPSNTRKKGGKRLAITNTRAESEKG